MIFAVNFQFKQLELRSLKKKNQGFNGNDRVWTLSCRCPVKAFHFYVVSALQFIVLK